MVIGIPREIKDQEHRVALLPSAAYQLARQGHGVVVETGAGIGAGYPDADYEAAGAKIFADHRAIFEKADLVVKVKEPLEPEYLQLRPGQLLFTYLHLAANRACTDALLQSGVTAIAYETIELNRRLPLLEPMSEIAGRMSVIVGGYFLAKHQEGSGVLLGGVPGVLPGKVVVLGGGTSGINAARMATGVGADVTILEVDLERMRFLDITLHTAHTLYSSDAHLMDILPSVDLLIGAVLVPGSAGAQAHSARDAAAHAAGERAGGHRDRPGRLCGNVAPDHPRSSGLHGGRGSSLLRRQYAGSLRPHRDPGSDQRDLPLRSVAGGLRARRCRATPTRPGQRHQRLQREDHPPRRGRRPRPALRRSPIPARCRLIALPGFGA
jgi:hypothetical protein